ncbi:hypothetical protein ABLE68_16685 [Nocardioides sp. CN2-186]|uniref:hypothetical protein n=1 Tax=Nocardioides tweenelious TaxID=3156607 RepID=UPI0032B4D3E6
MNRLDLLRRSASVVLVALLLVAVPAIAQAKFASSKSSTLAASTDRMETPTGITGSYRCTRSGSTESVSVTVSTFTDTGPAGSSYGFGLALGSTVKDTAYTSSKTQTLTGSRSYDGSSTTWTIGIQGYLSRWTSDIGTTTVVCPASASKTGTF